MTDTTPTADPPRFTYTTSAIGRNHVVHLVMDAVLQMDVFHWHGSTGKEKCEAVAAALNGLNHGKD